MDLTVIVLTYNEEKNLPDCLASLKDLGAPVFVVDSGSTDRTLAIAREFGAQQLSHPFETHARQWRWAIDSLPTATQWILGLDADQRLTPELTASLTHFLSSGQPASGAYLCRRQVFRGTWIRHGGYYPKYLLKLFRRDAVIIDDADMVDHHFNVRGTVAKLEGDLIEANRNEDQIRTWIAKHNQYAILQAREEILAMSRGNGSHPVPAGSPDETTAKMKRYWRRMPLYIRPFAYFGYRYFLRLGFLDGKQGFIFHFLQAFWYRLLVDINIEEMTTAGEAKR